MPAETDEPYDSASVFLRCIAECRELALVQALIFLRFFPGSRASTSNDCSYHPDGHKAFGKPTVTVRIGKLSRTDWPARQAARVERSGSTTSCFPRALLPSRCLNLASAGRAISGSFGVRSQNRTQVDRRPAMRNFARSPMTCCAAFTKSDLRRTSQLTWQSVRWRARSCT